MEKMKVVQCWDDGVITDIRLIEILKKYNAKATFNLNIGLMKPERAFPHGITILFRTVGTIWGSVAEKSV